MKIFFKTTADFNNTGEVLIYKSLLELLRKNGDVIVNDNNIIDKTFLNNIGIRENERLSYHTRKSYVKYMLWQSFSNNKIAFVSGLGDHKVTTLNDSVKNIFSFFFLCLLRLLGVKIVRIGASMTIKGRMASLSEKLVSLPMNHYYVRDSISHNNCLKAGVKKAKIAPDLSWAYNIEFLNQQKRTDCVYVSFRPYCDSAKNNTEYKEQLTQTIVYVINELCKQNYNVVLSYQGGKDLDYMKYIYNKVSQNNHIQLLEEMITLDNAEKYYGNAKYVLSNRLHCLLLGYKFGSPTICLTDTNKHQKIVGIFKDNGLLNAVIDINQSLEDIVSKIERINLNEIESRYKTAERNNQEVLNKIVDNIFSE